MGKSLIPGSAPPFVFDNRPLAEQWPVPVRYVTA
jgi:hypothetical protein